MTAGLGGWLAANLDLERFKRCLDLRALYLKAVLPLPYPQILNIEPTNRCNLACAMCPRSRSPRPLSDLDATTFQVLVDELARVGPILRVFLQKDGEPLLHPRLPEMVAELHRARAAGTLSVISNGTLLTEDLFVRLAEAGLDDLIVSLDAADPASYQTLKGRNLLPVVEANLRAALARKRKQGWDRPRLKARCVQRRGAEAEEAAFVARWQGVADAVDLTPYHDWLGAVASAQTYAIPARYPCSLLWYTGVVNADGGVSPCCIDWTGAGVVDRVGRQGFAPIWNGPGLTRLRFSHLYGKYDETAICGPCRYWAIKEDLGSWLRRKHRIPAPGDMHR